MSIEVTATLLHAEGKLIKHLKDVNFYLYSYNDINFVILSHGMVITQEEDNFYGEENAIFPISIYPASAFPKNNIFINTNKIK